MKKWWYPTAFSVWGDEEAEAIDRVRASGQYTMGEEVSVFEEAFARWHGREYAIMVNSGSSANLLMVEALFNVENKPLRDGDVVAVPAIAWSTTYAPLVQRRLQLRLLDVDDSWNVATLNQPEVAPGWNPRTRLVVGCSILGNPARLDRLSREASESIGSPYFIEDNCESFGARIEGCGYCGNFGLMSSFSFFYSHQISAIEGGMILTDSEELAQLLIQLRAHGWSRDLYTPRTFADEYDFGLFGYNVRPLEMHAAIAHEQLKKQEEHSTLRLANVTLFRSLVEGVQLPTFNSPHVNPFGICFSVAPYKRQAVVNNLRKNGIDCRLPTGGSFRRHKYGFNYRGQKTPCADHIHDAGLFLGNGPLDLSEHIHRAVQVIRETLHA